ncbi:MAG TPA: hypothetical protein VGE93_06610, partial [Bryobacteraceae bacterium]
MKVLTDTSIALPDPYARHLWPPTAVLRTNGTMPEYDLVTVADRALDAHWLEGLIEEIADTTVRYSNHRLWGLLVQLAEHGVERAQSAITEILDAESPERLGNMLADLTPATLPPDVLYRHLLAADPHRITNSSMHEPLQGVSAHAEVMWDFVHGAPDRDQNATISLNGAEWYLGDIKTLAAIRRLFPLTDIDEECHPGWKDWASLAKFAARPSRATFASAVRKIANFHPRHSIRVPWVFDEWAMLPEKRDRIEPGAWPAAEDRWRHAAVSLDDIQAYLHDGALTKRIATAGFPFSSAQWITPASSNEETNHVIRTVRDIWAASST